MPLPYIDTPRTEVDGNATFIRSAARHNLSALDSVENSFHSPSKDQDLLKEPSSTRSRKHRDYSLRTPRATAAPRSTRNAFHDRRNLPTAPPAKGEFTPLMKSVTKNNFLRNGTRARGVPETPAFLRDGYREQESPGLPRADASELYEDPSMATINEDHEMTPMPQAADSSAQSTPLPTLPGRDGNGVVGNGQNMMTLREQENIINKFDKENFGLKLKIHYLEEQLGKAGPDLNKVALKENTELKIARVTMQRDLHRCKKSLLRAERDLESCQVELLDLREKSSRKQADGALQKELDWVREELDSKETEVNELREELRSAQSKESEAVENLREEINELEFTVREKDRLIEDRDDEIEGLKMKEPEENTSVIRLEQELETAKRQIEELQASLKQVKSDSRETERAYEEAIQGKKQAVEDLEELQDEMANKSIHSKGLSRQLEDKAANLEDELTALRDENAELRGKSESRERQEYRLQERLKDLEDELASEKARLEHEIKHAYNEQRIAQHDRQAAISKLQEMEEDLQHRGDAKTLLQTRHDALTSESKSLQNDLDKAKRQVAELEEQVAAERQQSIDALEELKSRQRDDVDQMRDEIDRLRHDINDKTARFGSDKDRWESQRRSLELQVEQAEQQVDSYKRTVSRLQQHESTSTGKERKFQESIDAEKQRHQQQEDLLGHQIKELNDDISFKRETIESQRTELLTLKDDMRASRRESDGLRGKIQGLEDELTVLQASLEEEQEYAKERKTGSAGSENQLLTVTREKHALRDQLSNVNMELSELRVAISEIQVERDELHSQLEQVQNQPDDTYRLDQEKMDLRKAKLRLEGDVNRLKNEKRSLQDARDTLQRDLDSEIERAAAEENRLSTEVDQLQDKLFMSGGKRDRELQSSKSKIWRLETRLKELEALLDSHESTQGELPLASSPESSIIRQRLDEVRKREKASLQREADLKSSIRQLKSHISDLESENHDLQAMKIETTPLSTSSPSRLQEEIRSLRGQLIDAHKAAKSLRNKNNELQQSVVKEDERKDLHELLKSSTLEAESLSVKLSERDSRITELRAHLRRVRDERSKALKKLDLFDREVQTLQDKYDKLLDNVSNQSDRKTRHEKELKGLSKEILWLRARLSREQQFRNDLAWSKGLMELGERVRAACNETDLKMIAEMGVEPPASVIIPDSRRKLKAIFLTALATVRMQKMASDWSKTRKISEGLKKAKSEIMKKRERAKRLETMIS